MLTVNADAHPLMKRFHKPGDEKRLVVIAPRTGYADWLSCKSTDEARSFLQLYPAEAMQAEPYPPPHTSKPKAEDDQAPLLEGTVTMTGKLDDPNRADLLCHLVVAQLIARARTGNWLRTDHVVEAKKPMDAGS